MTKRSPFSDQPAFPQKKDTTHRPATRIIEAGRDPAAQDGAVNPPVYHASTILYPNVAAMKEYPRLRTRYGRHGTPGTHAFEDAMSELEGAAVTCLASSGLLAVTGSILSFVKAGDHLLMVDTVYEPTRDFCEGMLKRLGVETSYYDPEIGAGITSLLRPNTKVVFLEAPGSRSFEMQDVSGIAAAAKAPGVPGGAERVVIMDNTWATPLLFRPLEHGVDVSIQAATKYIVGHADAMLGTAAATDRCADQLQAGFRALGFSAAPDDTYLAFRGLKTLHVRLERHWRTAEALIEWLLRQPEVSRVLFPPLPTDPGHTLWKRDFDGASGLFGLVLNQGTETQAAQLCDVPELFGIGFSWGGYESLIVPNRRLPRSVTAWAPEGPSFRLHAGLEDPADLIADLQRGFEAFRAAG